jgi:Xaa-Pro dipeptidase
MPSETRVMTATVETLVPTFDGAVGSMADLSIDRRSDLEAKQTRVANLLQEVGCDGLLVLEPENFAWLTSGAAARGVLDPNELPALYFSGDGRWVVASNVDSQRIFDEELDGLGFQLKEWPWHWGREQLVVDLCHGRKVACDRNFANCAAVGDRLRRMRRPLTTYEQACYKALGAVVSHALEATCRTMQQGATEREVAGQLAHRLLHRGAAPVHLEVAADGRLRPYRQCGFTSLPVQRYCVLTATARKYGLCATASRSVCFGQPDADFRKEHDAACKVSATYVASTWPDAVPKQILTAGKRVYQVTGYEHEWRLCPQGHVTGRMPVEQPFTPQTDDLLKADWPLTWRASAGAAMSCDTFLVAEQGPVSITPPEMWPLKRIRIQGAEFFRPDVLLR